MRKHYPAEFKAESVIEVLRGEEALAEIASEREVHPAMLVRWRNAALEGLPRIFARDPTEDGVSKAEHERKVHELYAEIGRLSTDLKWLEQKVGRLR